MTDEEQKRIFSNNLNRYILKSGKQQKEVAEAIGANTSTFNMWCKGNSMPGTGKIRALADYFRIGMSDLTDMKENHDPDIEFGDVITKIEQFALYPIICLIKRNKWDEMIFPRGNCQWYTGIFTIA